MTSRTFFHLHLISDATGETLIAASRAAAAQYRGISSIEHIYPLVRSDQQLDKAISEIKAAPGIVLFTLVEKSLTDKLYASCSELGLPCLSVLSPIMNLFQSYLGTAATARPGAQHMLNSDYFRRIDALNYTMLHDDGQNIEDLDFADVVLVGVSRTSKTPTSIYLANRGIKTANVPIILDTPGCKKLEELKKALVVGLLASPDRIVQIRQNRLLALNDSFQNPYIDKRLVMNEIAMSRRLFEKNGWPIIDVSRRSIEETAASVIDLYREHSLRFIADG